MITLATAITFIMTSASSKIHLVKYTNISAAKVIILFFSLIGSLDALSAQPLYLNEVMASNSITIADTDGDFEDWVEVFYDGDEALNLDGYGLSDDYDRPFRWVFPDTTIQPGTFLLVWASNKDRRDPGDELHTNFAISSSGEQVILTRPDGERLDELAPTEIPTDMSIGRYPDGTGEWYFYTNPTPGEPNGPDGYQEMLEPVTFSHSGGFYTSSFQLELHHPDPDVSIIYTLDGSEPDAGNLNGTTYEHMIEYPSGGWGGSPEGEMVAFSYTSREYSEPIEIRNRTSDDNYLSRMRTASDAHPNPSHSLFKGTVVRAKAVREGALSEWVQTHTYFVTPQGRDRFSLPVIALTVQENHLFGYEDGIYVPGIHYREDGGLAANFEGRGIEWERPATMELFEAGSVSADHSQDIGLRIHGGYSRRFVLKSFRLYARSLYGDSRFNYQMFSDEPYNEYNRLLLRHAGNDFHGTMFRDAMMQRVIGHMKFDTQAYRPFVTLLNGEYWALLNLRERYDKHYLARVYGADPDNIDLLENNSIVKEGSNTHFQEMITYLRDNDISENEHYQEMKTRMDMENFIDYQVAQIYVGNVDWPGNNLDYWRYRTEEYNPDAPGQLDGRWRWLAYDLDFGFNLYGRTPPSHNTLEHATVTGGTEWPNPDWSTELLRTLLENPTFRNDFITRYLDQLNTAFQPERVVGIINEMAAHIQPEFGEHRNRWNQGNWNQINSQIIPFAEERQVHARTHLRNFFGISRQHNLTVNVSNEAAGRVQVNTIEISPDTPGVSADPWPWSGVYFRGVPVALKAMPWPGYAFSHWEGVASELGNDKEIEVNLTSNFSITAVFQPDQEFDAQPAAFRLSTGNDTYTFDSWPLDSTPGTYPENMVFVFMDELDPGLEAEVSGFTDGAYNLDSRTRINAQGEDGFSFINTSNEDGNPGYPGVRLGGAILALNTTGAENIRVEWEGLTVRPNSRVYNLRLQYRIGNEAPFTDLLDADGNFVEYQRNEDEGHRQWIGPVTLPEALENKGYVQLLWRYYYTGERLDEESGQRSKLAVRNIVAQALSTVSSSQDASEIPETLRLKQNYPNPFNPATTIRFDLPHGGDVRLEIYDVIGQRVATVVDGYRQAGSHQAVWDADNHTSGIYIYRLHVNDNVLSRKMLLLK